MDNCGGKQMRVGTKQLRTTRRTTRNNSKEQLGGTTRDSILKYKYSRRSRRGSWKP